MKDRGENEIKIASGEHVLPSCEEDRLLERYGADLQDDNNLSDAQKKEFLLALWIIMRAFAEVGFSLKAGDKFQCNSDIGMDDVLKCLIPEDTAPETVASSQKSRTRRLKDER